MTREEFIGKLRSIYVGEENAIDEIISEYDRLKEENRKLKVYLKPEYIVNELKEKDKEIDRLNNIIEQLEEFLNKVVETGASIEQITCKNILNYLQELKESNKWKEKNLKINI